MRNRPRALCHFICLLFVSTLCAAQGKYAPVTNDDVVTMKLHHYFNKDKKSRERDFEWTFADTGFVIKPGSGAIPEDLVEKLLPEGTEAKEITGKWSIDSKTGEIVFTEIRAGDFAGRENVRCPLYRTAPTVIRLGDPQYVFALP